MRALIRSVAALATLAMAFQACDDTADATVIGVGPAADGLNLAIYVVACSKFEEKVLRVEVEDTQRDTTLWQDAVAEGDVGRTQKLLVSGVALPTDRKLVASAQKARGATAFTVSVEFRMKDLRAGQVYSGTGDYESEADFFAHGEEKLCKH